MPDNAFQWAFFGFFLVGAFGGWVSLFRSWRGLFGSRPDTDWIDAEPDTEADTDLTPRRVTPAPRTRENLPVYVPRKKGDPA